MEDNSKTTLREFINELEKLSDGGKNDNLEVGVLSYYDEEFCPLENVCVDEYYPKEELDTDSPEHPTKCIMIQY